MFCRYCGLLGHDIKHCARHFAALKKGGEVVYPYGDWMKAVRPRSWSPTRRDSSRYLQKKKKVETENKNSRDEGGMQAPTAMAVVAGSTMVREDDKYEKGKNEKYGTDLKS